MVKSIFFTSLNLSSSSLFSELSSFGSSVFWVSFSIGWLSLFSDFASIISSTSSLTFEISSLTCSTFSGFNASGRLGRGMVFDSVDDYVGSMGDESLKPKTAMTFMAWAKPGNVSTSKTVMAHSAAYLMQIDTLTRWQVLWKLNGAFQGSRCSSIPPVEGTWVR